MIAAAYGAPIAEVRNARMLNGNLREVLELAAKEGEARVDEALGYLLEQGELGEGKLNVEAVRAILAESGAIPPATDINVADVSLESFDELLGGGSGVLQ